MTKLEPCSELIANTGVQVFATHTIASSRIEAWVTKIAKLSGQDYVDWYYHERDAIVKAIGDIEAVHNAIVALRAEHDAEFLHAREVLHGPHYSNDEQDQQELEKIWSAHAAIRERSRASG